MKKNVIVFSGVIAVLLNCGILLDTAKVRNGISYGVGIGSYLQPVSSEKYRYETPYFYIAGFLTYGFKASRKFPGIEIGYKSYIFGITPKTVDYDFISNLSFSSWSIKLQLPENPYSDLAFMVDFWGLSPYQFSFIMSKNFRKNSFSPFFRIGFSYPSILRVTSGIEILRYRKHLFVGIDFASILEEEKNTLGLYTGIMFSK